jgi:hypothetical protein
MEAPDMAPETGEAYADTFERVSVYVENHPGCDAAEVALALGALRGATDAALRRLERGRIRATSRRALSGVQAVSEGGVSAPETGQGRQAR